MNFERLYQEAYRASVECMNLLEWPDNLQKEFLDNPMEHTDVPCLGHLAWIMTEALEGMDTKITPKTTISAVKRMMDSRRKEFFGIFERDGMFCVCDGYRMVRLKHDIECIPHVSGGSLEPQKYIDGFGFERIELPLPTIAEIKAWLKQHPSYSKYQDRPPFLLAGCIPVNGEFLKDMMMALPNCKAYVPQKIHNPILFEAETGDGILLPIRVHSVENSDECLRRFDKLRTAS